MYIEFALLLNALLLGVMTSFMIVTSPTVFKTLDEENSKKFLRSIFPRLFNFCFLISAFVFLFFALGDFFYGTVVAIGMSISFLVNTYLLTPRINMMRDLSLAGDKRLRGHLNTYTWHQFFYIFSIRYLRFRYLFFTTLNDTNLNHPIFV